MTDTQIPTPDQFLMGGGCPSAKFDNPGDITRGTVLDTAVQQQTEMGTNAPKFWPDGNPMLQLVITLQTEERDPTKPDDDGRRRIYAKGSKSDPTTSLGCIARAVQESGRQGLEVGGVLAVQFTGLGAAKVAGHNAPKQYRAQYQPPALAGGDLLATPAPHAPPPPAPAGPPAPGAQAPAPQANPLAAAGDLLAGATPAPAAGDLI